MDCVNRDLVDPFAKTFVEKIVGDSEYTLFIIKLAKEKEAHYFLVPDAHLNDDDKTFFKSMINVPNEKLYWYFRDILFSLFLGSTPGEGFGCVFGVNYVSTMNDVKGRFCKYKIDMYLHQDTINTNKVRPLMFCLYSD